MAERTVRVVIDAAPRGPLGPWGWQRVGDRTSLARLVKFAARQDEEEIRVYGCFEDTPVNLEIAAGEIPEERPLYVSSEPAPSGGIVLRTDRVYDEGALAKAIRAGASPETAVLWRLDVKSDLTAAAEELNRRASNQPVGRFWAWQPARVLAERLRPTQIRPNHVTVAAFVCFVAASAVVGFGDDWWLARLTAALLLAGALVLDTADGHLARRQGTASPFGRWLDATLDELGDLILHGAIAWAMYVRTSNPIWLVAGLVYAGGKHLFFTSAANGPACNQSREPADGAESASAPAAAQVVRWIAHADVRWHLWIVCALFGWLPGALLAYAAYYPMRAALVARSWVVRHG